MEQWGCQAGENVAGLKGAAATPFQYWCRSNAARSSTFREEPEKSGYLEISLCLKAGSNYFKIFHRSNIN